LLRYAVAILKKKATKFRNIFFPGREGGARVVAKPVVFATESKDRLFWLTAMQSTSDWVTGRPNRPPELLLGAKWNT
jgi:hypothetical protein